jgi:hypothetical protein
MGRLLDIGSGEQSRQHHVTIWLLTLKHHMHILDFSKFPSIKEVSMDSKSSPRQLNGHFPNSRVSMPYL